MIESEVSRMKPEEVALLRSIAAGESLRDAGARMGIPQNRVRYLGLKWASKGWYEYGVVYDLGWLTAKGRAQVERLALAQAEEIYRRAAGSAR